MKDKNTTVMNYFPSFLAKNRERDDEQRITGVPSPCIPMWITLESKKYREKEMRILRPIVVSHFVMILRAESVSNAKFS